jgi:hypothetical protein
MDKAIDTIQQIKSTGARQNSCRHILASGQQCGSPAMRGERFCYYHHSTRKPVVDLQRRQARRNSFDLTAPRNRTAIQDSLGKVLTRIASNDIDPRRAGLLLYALQIASTNLSRQMQDKLNSAYASPTKDQVSGASAADLSSAIPNHSGSLDPAFEEEAAPPIDPRKTVSLSRPVFTALLDALARHRGDLSSTEAEPQLQAQTQPGQAIQPAVLPSLKAEALEEAVLPIEVQSEKLSFQPKLQTHSKKCHLNRSEVERPAVATANHSTAKPGAHHTRLPRQPHAQRQTRYRAANSGSPREPYHHNTGAASST